MPLKLAYPRRSHPRSAYPGPRNGPLDNGQKAALCILAKEAFEHCGGERETGMSFEDWRHHEQQQACGCDSLRFASQADYRTLLAHFLNLKGESGQAFNVIRQQQTSALDLPKAKLRAALETAGKAWSYAETICRAQNHGLTIDELKSPKPIWRLVFTITNRGNSAKRKAAADELDAPEGEDPF